MHAACLPILRLRHIDGPLPLRADRVTLYPIGLGSRNDSCFIVSEDINVGDGVTTCGVSTPEEARAKFAVSRADVSC
jgi:hypothetical protein